MNEFYEWLRAKVNVAVRSHVREFLGLKVECEICAK